MDRRVLMAEMTWVEFQARMRERAPVILPIGSTEQHGHHLPLGVDVVLPTAVALGVAPVIGALVAPTIPYGFKSQPKTGGGQHFPGTTSLDAATLVALLRDVLRDLIRHGARRVALLNGHYENQMFAIEAVDLARRDAAATGVRDLLIARFEYWDFTRKDVLAALFPDGFPGFDLEHAALMETSLLLHLRPDLVDMERLVDEPAATFPPYEIYPLREGLVPPAGVLSPARTATAEKGRLLYETTVADIAEALRQEFALEEGAR